MAALVVVGVVVGVAGGWWLGRRRGVVVAGGDTDAVHAELRRMQHALAQSIKVRGRRRSHV